MLSESCADTWLAAHKTTDKIILQFEDEGIPYNPLEKADPDITLPPEQRPCGGLGIFMVKKTMDRVDYEYKNNENRLTLVKKI